MTYLGIRKETEPGAVGILLADVEALKLIFGRNNVNKEIKSSKLKTSFQN